MNPADPWAPPPPPPSSPPRPQGPQLRRVRRVGILSMGKVYGVLLALMGLVFGLFFALLLMAAPATDVDGEAVPGGFLAGMGVFMIVLFPLMYGGMGFVVGALGAALYNLVARWIGGVEIEVE